MNRISKSIFIMLLIFTGITGRPLIRAADTYLTSEIQTQTDPDDTSLLADLFKNHFKYELRVLTYGLYQDPACSTQNPDNRFLDLPRYKGDLEIRPDLRLDFDTVLLSAKPRMQLEYRSWQEGDRSGESDWSDDWFINEWLARIKLHETLFVSYGRENLQWGPCFLFSPSNPFFKDNGKRNPKQEIAGMGFGRLVLIPSQAWSLSFIAHTDEGRNKNDQTQPFQNTYALKIDYAGRECYTSFILSHCEDSRKALGFFSGWTFSDALLLYGEGVLYRGGGPALYPRESTSPLGATMQPAADTSALHSILLIGGSYTFENSGNLTIEYAYNSQGYGAADAERYYQIRRKASESLESGGLLSSLSRQTLAQTADPGLRFLRKNYLLLQYNRNDIWDVFDLTLRWTHNRDDRSDQFNVIWEFSLNDHMEVFSIVTLNHGGGDTEFGSILEHQWVLGLEYVF